MTKKIKVLNLYAGIGGNRKLWENVEVTAVEVNSEIAAIYKDFFPYDKVIIADAHEYLLNHYKEFDFIWSSPPCPTHSRVRKVTEHQNKPIFPDMKLYEEILFLKGYFKGEWVVENVVSWYDPLIKPYNYNSHYYWSSFFIPTSNKERSRCHNDGIIALQKLKGFDLRKYKISSYYSKEKILRNCVEPKAALKIFNMAFKEKQNKLIEVLE